MSFLFEYDGMQDVADGVDFVPLWFEEDVPPPILESYTKEEFEKIQCYPKSNRKYWKIVDGKKVYIN